MTSGLQPATYSGVWLPGTILYFLDEDPLLEYFFMVELEAWIRVFGNKVIMVLRTNMTKNAAPKDDKFESFGCLSIMKLTLHYV
jgi:hypothetical protein